MLVMCHASRAQSRASIIVLSLSVRVPPASSPCLPAYLPAQRQPPVPVRHTPSAIALYSMGKESITYHFLRTNADRICALLTPYNIAWTALVLLLLYLQRRGRTGLKNLKVSLPDEAHVLLGHAKFFDVDFLQVFGRICVGGADMYGLSSFFILHNLTVCGKEMRRGSEWIGEQLICIVLILVVRCVRRCHCSCLLNVTSSFVMSCCAVL